MEEPAVRAGFVAEREGQRARIAAMASDFDAIVSASADANGDDEHDPEGSTVAFERAGVAALMARAQGAVDRVDRALARLDDGTYGRCHRCGGRIAAARLTALPAAETCVGCADRVPATLGHGGDGGRRRGAR